MSGLMVAVIRPVPYGCRVGRGSPLLEGEGQGEVCDLFGEGTPLTPTLSPWEREPALIGLIRSGRAARGVRTGD